jgi:hypothetical protein
MSTHSFDDDIKVSYNLLALVITSKCLFSAKLFGFLLVDRKCEPMPLAGIRVSVAKKVFTLCVG